MLFRRVGCPLTIAVLCLTAAVHECAAEDPPMFLLKWGSFCNTWPGPPCTGLLYEPFDLTIGPNGDVYVSDTVNQRIQQFSPTGTFVRTWGSFCNIADGTQCVDPDGGGPLQLGDGEFWDPVGLTFNAAGNLHVTEWSNDRVQVFDATGQFIRKWGSTGIGPGQFDTADDVAFDSMGRVFVVDKLNNRIQVFSATGSFLYQWGTFGSANGQFKKPVGIAIDASDNVYVAEQLGHRIQKFTTAGVFVTKWGTQGAGPGQFDEPIHIAVDAAGNVYVPDSKNHRIQKFDGAGVLLTMWGSYCNLVDGTGCVDPDGAGPLQLGDGQFKEPEGVTVDAAGDVYVVDTHNHRVQKFRPGGAPPPVDCACLAPPPADRAAFKIGAPRPVPGEPDQVAVPLLVDTSEDVTFTQMTIEYDSGCMTYVSTTLGTDVGMAGGILDIDDPGAVDPSSDRNLTVNVPGTYTGCDQEVFVVTFEITGGPCALIWDPTPGGANSNNHVNYADGGADERIFPPDITFCAGQVDRPPCPACDPMALPPDDTAVFKVGEAFVDGTQLRVPLLVDTRENVTFTQMTIEYDSNCMTYASTDFGGDIVPTGTPDAFDDPGAVDPGSDRNLTVQATGTYTGCDQEVLIVTFDLAAGPPCSVVWDPTPGGPNSNNHLNYNTATGGDGKIIPPDIAFCASTTSACGNSNVRVSGTVEYYSNGEPITAGTPDPASAAVVVEDAIDQIPTTTATGANAAYSLDFGVGPQSVNIEAHRPIAPCGSNEDGVVGGDDVILLQNSLLPPGVTDPKLRVAGDVNRDGVVNATDVLAIKRWIARKVCDGTDGCAMTMNRNCAGTWRFLFFDTAPGFDSDSIAMPAVCDNTTVDVEGVLVGDFDGSWPSFTAKTTSQPGLSLTVTELGAGQLGVVLTADIAPHEELRHVIYSMTYDETQFEYDGARLGREAASWDLFENPDAPGIAHGILHIRPRTPALTQSGQVAVFHFRARQAGAMSRIGFSRLKVNDADAAVPVLEVAADGDRSGVPLAPERYAIRCQPNPFNPSTQIVFTIPAGEAQQPVELQIFDIAGRLVRTLVRERFGPGEYQIPWNGRTGDDRSVRAGIYVVRIRAGAWNAIQKIALVK